jgi:hypothetical protein
MSLWLLVLFFGCAGKEPKVATVDQVPPSQAEASAPSAETEAAEVPQYLPTATVTTSKLNLREESTPRSEIVAVLRSGDRLEVLSRSSGWLEVRTSEGKTGWINGEYVDVVDEAEGLPLEATDPSLAVLTPPPESIIEEEALETTAPEQSKKSTPQLGQKPPEVLRKELESVWNDYRRAHAVGDLALLKKTSSDYSYGTMVNALAKAGKSLNPEALTFFYEMMPDVANLEFIELMRNGPTAGMLYTGLGGDDTAYAQPPQPRFLYIKFVEERRGWTVDGAQTTPASDQDQSSDNNDFDPAALPTELAIDGVVRPAPESVMPQ